VIQGWPLDQSTWDEQPAGRFSICCCLSIAAHDLKKGRGSRPASFQADLIVKCAPMNHRILVFYGSYRSDRMGIGLTQFVVEGFRTRGDDVALIDAKAVGLPMLERMYKEYPRGAAPQPLEKLASEIRAADGFVFITGEYNWGIQPGLKNLTDHFLEE